jgi:hypothetical protein
VLTLVSSLSTVAFVAVNNVNLAFAKQNDSSGSGGGGSSSKSATTAGGSDSSTGGGDTSNTTPPPATGETTTPPATGETTTPPATGETTTPPANQQTCPDGSAPDANGNCPTTTPPTNEATPTATPPPAAPVGNETGTAPGGGATPPATSPTNTPPLTPPTPQQQYEDCLRGIGGGIPGNCKPPPPATSPTNTPPLTPEQDPNCRGVAAPPPGTCLLPSTTPPPATPPTNTPPLTPLTPRANLIKQTCPPQPIDASGRCPGVDMRGGGLGLPPPPQGTCPPLPIDANGNCPGVDMRGGGLGLPPPPQGHVTYPPDVMIKPKLADGSCPAGYHIDDGNCPINSVAKLPNGNCPVGAVMTQENTCVRPPVLPGSTTGPGGGFIQMFPSRPPNPDGTCPKDSHSVESGTGVTCVSDSPAVTPLP